jgi:hypothetical protein
METDSEGSAPMPLLVSATTISRFVQTVGIGRSPDFCLLLTFPFPVTVRGMGLVRLVFTPERKSVAVAVSAGSKERVVTGPFFFETIN